MRSSVVSVAMVAAVAVAAALAPPAPASAQPGLDDPQLLAWMHAANAAQRSRLDELASREDARSLLMAMQLVHPMFPLREDPEEEIAAEQARAWSLLERAAQAGPDDPVVAWKLATCPAESGLAACGSPQSRERLARVAGGYAASHLWLAQVAQAVGDEAEVEARLQAASVAPSWSFEQEIGELVWRAWESVEFPEAGAGVAQAYARQMEIDADAFVDQVVALSALARIAAQSLPAYPFPYSVCDVAGDGEGMGPRLRSQCRSIFTTMSNDRPSLLQRMVADRAMVALGRGGAEADQWKERLRSTWWVREKGVPLTVAMSTRHDQRHFEAWRKEGELKALLQLMARNGVETAPPDGWLPENEEARELLDGDGAASPRTENQPAPSTAGTQPE